MRRIPQRAGLLLACAAMLLALDAPARWRAVPTATAGQTLFFELRDAPFPGSGRPDVAVHVPPGFAPGRRPAVVVYFHGWNGCVQAAMADDDQPCVEDGPTRAASHLASQLDDSAINALLVAVELRVDMPSGETGALSVPGALRAMLRELFEERLPAALGATLDVDALDRVIVVAHSGGYQAAAAALRFGELQNASAVVLLDALYGADEVFRHAVEDQRLRLVNLYTSSGGTRDRTLELCRHASSAGVSVAEDDGPGELDPAFLSGKQGKQGVVCKQVPRPHAELPAAYMRAVLGAFATLGTDTRAP